MWEIIAVNLIHAGWLELFSRWRMVWPDYLAWEIAREKNSMGLTGVFISRASQRL
jgi:hypothetical protein